MRHLAYCIYSYENLKHNIYEWDVVDILSVQTDKTHDNDYELSKQWDIEKLTTYLILNNIDVPKKKDEKLKLVRKHLKKTTKVSSKCSLDDLSIRLLTWLDSKFENFLDCNVVALENQPCLKNPVMKSIQMIIYGYFIHRGVIQKDIPMYVRLISATNKLKIIPYGFDGVVGKNYNDRKKAAIAFTVLYFQDETLAPWKLFWENNKKKDDLSDCFLQAIYVGVNISSFTC